MAFALREQSIKEFCWQNWFNAGIGKRSNLPGSGPGRLVRSGVRILLPAIMGMEEKAIFKNSKGLELRGILHTPKGQTDSIVVMAHGFCSNKDRERTVETAELYAKNGIAALRFDFGGSGESYKTEITVGKQVDDLKSAIKFVKGKGYKKIGLQGESLGGLVSILAHNAGIKAMVLWAPVTEKKKNVDKVLAQEGLSKEEFERIGHIVKKKDGKDFVIPKKYFEERIAVNQKKILSKIKCPVLILHGEKDDVVPLEDSKEAVKILKNSKLEIIAGLGHRFKFDDKKVSLGLSLKWFKEHLKEAALK